MSEAIKKEELSEPTELEIIKVALDQCDSTPEEREYRRALSIEDGQEIYDFTLKGRLCGRYDGFEGNLWFADLPKGWKVAENRFLQSPEGKIYRFAFYDGSDISFIRKMAANYSTDFDGNPRQDETRTIRVVEVKKPVELSGALEFRGRDHWSLNPR